MTRHAAFLRGINLGNRRIKMDELRARFEDVDGLDRVATFLASGNVAFDADYGSPDDLERRIERHLHESLGYEVATFVRAFDRLERVVRQDLFDEVDEPGRKLHVVFLKTAPVAAGEAALRELETEDDGFRVVGREAYWLRRGRMSDSGFKPGDFERALGVTTSTMRTMNTVERLVAKFGRVA
jgi:uncharacterized protein (DUF1697 family)